MTLSRPVALGTLALALTALSACERKATPEEPGGRQSPMPAPVAAPPSPPAPVVPTMNLNEGRLRSRDCATVVMFYGDALRAGQYPAATRVWAKDGGVTAAALERRFAGLGAIKFDIGEVAEEGAAGSLYCTAQITLRDSSKAQPGTLTLRRVNDVPGATADQLRWHIVQSTLGENGKPSG